MSRWARRSPRAARAARLAGLLGALAACGCTRGPAEPTVGSVATSAATGPAAGSASAAPLPSAPAASGAPERRCLPVVAAECGCVYDCAPGEPVGGGIFLVNHPFWSAPVRARVDRYCVGEACATAFFGQIVCDGICAPKPADATCRFEGERCVGGGPSAAPSTRGPGRARGSLESGAAAIDAFRAAWAAEVSPGAAGPAGAEIARLGDLGAALGAARAARAPCREGRARIEDTLTAAERRTLLLFGAPAHLDRDGACWRVEAPVTPFRSVIAELDAATGALLVVWYPPEG